MRFWKVPKPVAVAIASYELLALSTGKFPTISQICNKYPPVGLLIIAWLIDHLFITGVVINDSKIEVTSQSRTSEDQQRPVVLRLV